MRRLVRWGGVLLGTASMVYFVAFAYRTATGYDLRLLGTGPMVLAIGIAAISYGSVIPTSSWAWGRLLRGTGVRFPTLELNMIMGTSQIAKYLPGNMGQHLGRSAMAIQWGIPAGAVFVTLVAETLLAIAAAVVVGVLGLVIVAHGREMPPAGHLGSVVLVVFLSAIVLASLLPATRRSPLLARWLEPYLPAATPAPASSVCALVTAFLAYVVNYIVVGVGLYAIGSAAIELSPAAAPLFIGAFALSWIAGFVVPGAPAGLGVREGVMAALLAPPLEGARAFETIVAFRVATTLGDLLGLAWGGGIYLVKRRRVAPTSTSQKKGSNGA